MHTKEEHIEQQLWEYIDGSCNDAERQRMKLLIAQNETWRTKHNELLSLHAGIGSNMELEQPPLRFTMNIMDAIATAHPMAAPKRYINRAVIRGIAAFFIICIGLMLGYILLSTDWNAPSTTVSRYMLPKVQLHTILDGNFFNVVIAVNVILGLALLDLALRAKRPQHH